MLSNMRGGLPKHMYVQLDGAGDNKNWVMFVFWAMLVDLGYFETVLISFLMVGHTHEDIDQRFSIISKSLRTNYALTYDRLEYIIRHAFATLDVRQELKEKKRLITAEDALGAQSNPNITVASQLVKTKKLLRVHDWNLFLEPYCSAEFGGFKYINQFKIQKSDETGKVGMWYKPTNAHTVWLPQLEETVTTEDGHNTIEYKGIDPTGIQLLPFGSPGMSQRPVWAKKDPMFDELKTASSVRDRINLTPKWAQDAHGDHLVRGQWGNVMNQCAREDADAMDEDFKVDFASS